MNFSTTIFSFRTLCLLNEKKRDYLEQHLGKKLHFLKNSCVSFALVEKTWKNYSPSILYWCLHRKWFKFILPMTVICLVLSKCIFHSNQNLKLFFFLNVKQIEEGNIAQQCMVSKCCRVAVCLSCTKPVIHSETMSHLVL